MQDNPNLILGMVALLVIAIFIISNYIRGLKRRFKEAIKEKDLIIQRDDATLRLQANEMAKAQLEQWVRERLAQETVSIKAEAERGAAYLLDVWKITETQKIRKESVNKSMGTNYGKITEHLLPFSDYLKQFNPRDIRFIGSPVDLMIFDGITLKKDIIDIYFVEIKTSKGQLSPKQKKIGEAISKGRIHWLPIYVPKIDWQVPEEDGE
jgi:predicted Holliday junction resolvase-like endonuclease